MKYKEWVYNENIKEGVSLIDRLLLSRGITEKEQIEEFLNPLEMQLTSPYVFTDMQKAVDRIVKAVINREKIIIYGDFDSDGITSTSLMMKVLNYLEANVDYYIPHREKEGHGLDSTSLVKVITAHKPKLVITVDNGISNVKEVSFLKSFGIDTIITDHHEAQEELPSALAIIDPKAPNALSDELSARKIQELTYLAGVGVAFKVAQALLEKFEKTEFIPQLLPFVAVGTVADIVPLLGENRYFVKRGLELILNHRGIKALLEGAGYNISKPITSENIAFGIAPRLNASGRLETVDSAMKLMLSDNSTEIQFAVQSLNEFNAIRQKLCSDTFEKADEMWQKEGAKNPAVVLFNPEWHIGIIGIVASKFVEKYHKPAFLMTYSEETQQFRCSARGVKGLNIFDIIKEVSEKLDGFGGHELAGGFSFSKDKTSFEDVKMAINKTIKEMLNGKELKPCINVDLKLKESEITIGLVEQLKVLEPFGACNPNPVFAVENLRVNEKKMLGSDLSHLKLRCEINGNFVTCLMWSIGDIELKEGDRFDALFHPEIDEYRGRTNLQLILHDIHSDAITYDKDEILTAPKVKFFDHRGKTDILSLVNDYIKNSKHNISVFAESKQICDSLKPYEEIYSRIVNRNTVDSCDSIMFFEYPADKLGLSEILEKAQASEIHIMRCEIKHFSPEDLLTTAAKMLKYAQNYASGNVELYRFASFLGINDVAVVLLLDIFREIGFIKLVSHDSTSVQISINGEIRPADTLHCENYSQFTQAVKDSKEFLDFLMNDDFEKIQELFV